MRGVEDCTSPLSGDIATDRMGEVMVGCRHWWNLKLAVYMMHSGPVPYACRGIGVRACHWERCSGPICPSIIK